jgi:outer membrane receptor protein involved in Fe transport
VPESADNIATARLQLLNDTEIAAFGEANYNITEKLRVTAGVRMSRVTFDYSQSFYGPLSGWSFPTVANTGIVGGSVTESPVTPKLGAQYQFTSDDMVYLSASKGYRAGGVNSPISPSICAAGFAVAGIGPQDIPTTYGSDVVWSYEAGTKVRVLDGRVQVNASAFRIDWDQVQLDVGLGAGCAQNYTTNAGKARSQGFDLQAQARLFAGFSATLGVGYTDAVYTQGAFGPKPVSGAAPTPVVQKGDVLPVPPWTVSVGGQYNFDLGGMGAYVRADYRFTSKYLRGRGPGVGSYSPDTINAEATQVVNARAGVSLKGWDVNVFVNNLFNSTDLFTLTGGRGNCPIASGASCAGYSSYNPIFSGSTFRPREIGVQAAFRY